MNSWSQQTINNEHAISSELNSFKPVSKDLSCDAKGIEGGLINILQQEQELHALQKALNLPQTTTYSTNLAKPHKTGYQNSSIFASSANQTTSTKKCDIERGSVLLGTSDLCHQNISRDKYFNSNTDSVNLGATYSQNGRRNFDSSLLNTNLFRDVSENLHEVKPSTRSLNYGNVGSIINGAPDSYQRNTSISSFNCPSDYHQSGSPFKSYQEFNKSKNSYQEFGRSKNYRPVNTQSLKAQEISINETLNLHQSQLHNPASRYGNEYDSTLRASRYGRDIEVLLDKIKEAYKIIQYQKEALAKSENEISSLHRHQTMLELDKEAQIQEITTLKLENQNMEKVNKENAKKREVLMGRINKLDQDFKELSVSHNALLVECKKREGDFLQSDLKLNALESYNINLQQANTRMQRECEVSKQQVIDIMEENRRIKMEERKAQEEAALALQDKQRITVENASLQSASSELNQQLLTVKSGKQLVKQELEKIKLEYNLKCNRVSLLEEEVNQQQETLAVLRQELEQSFEREARKSSMNNSFLNVSTRQKLLESQSQGSDHNSACSEIQRLKAELVQRQEEDHHCHEELQSVRSEHSRLLIKNKGLKEKLDYLKNIKGQLEKEILDISHDNECLYKEITDLKEQQSYKVDHLKEELVKIKDKLTGIETEKCSLISELQEFQHEKDRWEKEKGEMIMSLAELEAENKELQQKLKSVIKKTSDESVSDDVVAIRRELENVHKMLRLKDKEMKTLKETLEVKDNKLNKLSEEAGELKKSNADMSSKSTSRNLVISTLRNDIEDRDKRITQLEADLSAKTHEFEELCSCHSKLETDLSQSSSECLLWITAERKKLEEQRDLFRNQVHDLQSRLDKKNKQTNSSEGNDETFRGPIDKELQELRSENAALVSRLKVLVDERDSVLQDSEDLMDGMQQLKEAFEDEIERRVERERENFITEQESFMEGHRDLINEHSEMKEQCRVVDETNRSLELQCKNVEFERDELRKQVHELCEQTLSEEKTTQTDLSQPSPRRKDSRLKKRSKSVGVIVPILSIDEADGEEPISSPDRSPPSGSPRRRKHSS